MARSTPHFLSRCRPRSSRPGTRSRLNPGAPQRADADEPEHCLPYEPDGFRAIEQAHGARLLKCVLADSVYEDVGVDDDRALLAQFKLADDFHVFERGARCMIRS